MTRCPDCGLDKPLSAFSPRDVPAGFKWCADCDTVKPVEDFCRNKNTSTGRATYCKLCHNARSREARERLYGGGREYHLRRRYGIGQPDVDRMLAAQGGVCEKPDPEHVDHDHKTGQVRGMLCFNCNQALGNVRDSAYVLDRLREYLYAASTAVDLPHFEYRARGIEFEVATEFVHAGGTR